MGGYQDPDIVVEWKDEQDFGVYLENEFGYKPFKNSNVYSFPYKGFQVDVTFHPMHDFNMAVDYSSWGDLGNIMGRVFHKMGLHFGHSGLSFWIRQGLFDNNLQWSNSDHIYEKVILTNNMIEICEIGGFDYLRWQKGFDTEQDAFEFVVNSKYFHPDLFQLENLNHTNRTRNKKRGMYMRFIEHVNSKEWTVKEPFHEKATYALYYQTVFPQLHELFSKYRLEYEISKVVKQKLNGKQVIEWLSLEDTDGPCVGKIMSRMKEIYTPAELLILPIEKIKKDVVESYSTLC